MSFSEAWRTLHKQWEGNNFWQFVAVVLIIALVSNALTLLIEYGVGEYYATILAWLVGILLIPFTFAVYYVIIRGMGAGEAINRILSDYLPHLFHGVAATLITAVISIAVLLALVLVGGILFLLLLPFLANLVNNVLFLILAGAIVVLVFSIAIFCLNALGHGILTHILLNVERGRSAWEDLSVVRKAFRQKKLIKASALGEFIGTVLFILFAGIGAAVAFLSIFNLDFVVALPIFIIFLLVGIYLYLRYRYMAIRVWRAAVARQRRGRA